jgi:hypothetical protein
MHSSGDVADLAGAESSEKCMCGELSDIVRLSGCSDVLLKYVKSATRMSRDCLQLLTLGKETREKEEKVQCGKFTFLSDQTADQAWQSGINVPFHMPLPSFNPHSDRLSSGNYQTANGETCSNLWAVH